MATIRGTNARNRLVGTSSADTILGLAGNDTLLGGGGNDTIRGGTGNDIINGGAGNDRLFGDAGNDTLAGGTGTDTAFFSGLSTDSTINQVGTNLVITGANGVDTLAADVEFVQFTDGVFSAVAKAVTLTTATDLPPSTTGSLRNDTYNGSVNTDAPLLTTFNTGDNLDGGGSSGDRLNLVLSGTGALNLTGTQLANIEIVQVQNVGVNPGVTFDTALWTGVASIVLNASLAGSNTLFTNLVNMVSAQMQGGNFGNLSIVYGAGVLDGLADAQSLALAGSNEGARFSVSGSTAEILNIASNAGTVFRNAVTIDATNAHDTVNISGTHHLDLDLDGATSVTTINAAAFGNAGDELLVFNIGMSDISITGSGFADEFIFATDSVDSADAIGGGGGMDAIGFTVNTNLIDADLASKTSIERLIVGSLGPIVTLTAMLDANAQAMGLTTVDAAENGQVDLLVTGGFTGPLTVNLDSDGATTNGADVVDGSAMAGKLTVAAFGSHVSNDTLTGGTGTTDELMLTADDGTASLTGVSKFETVTVLAGASATDGLALTTADTTVDAGKTLTVNATALGSGAGLDFDGSLETNGRFKVTGGAGADTITGGAGNDELIGGGSADELYGGFGDDILTGDAGNDVIEAGVGGGPGLGNETVTGGAGDDVIIFNAAELTAGDSVDGGLNTDTLVIADGVAVSDGQFAGVVSVEVLTSIYTPEDIDQALNVSLGVEADQGGIRTLNTGTGTNDSIVIGAGFTSAVTINIGTGVDMVDASPSTADVTVNATASDITAADTLTGGSNAGDVLALVATGGTANLGGVSGFESLNFSGTSATTVTLGANTVGNLNLLTVGATSVTSGLTLNASALTGGTKRISLTSGTGIDVITASGGADNINTGGGDDTINIGGNLNSLDLIDGGAGTGDKLLANAGYNDSAFAGVSNVEILELQTSGTTTLGLEANNGGAGIKRVVGTIGSDVINIAAGFTGALTVDLKTNPSGADTVDAATVPSAAVVTVEANASDISDDTLKGGTTAGDVLKLTADGGAGATLGVGDSGFENITVVANGINNITIDITVDSVVEATGMTINGSALIADTGALAFNGSAVTSLTKALVVTGGAQNDTLEGGSGADTLNGGAGDDTLTGGIGNDTVNAGNGSDTVHAGLGNDTINLGAEAGPTDIDRVVFVGFSTTGLATISGFDAATSSTSEDIIDIDAVVDFAVGGELRAASAGGPADVKLVVLDNNAPGYADLNAATGAADLLQSGEAFPDSYLFVWNDMAGAVHVSIATAAAGLDLGIDLAKLTGVPLANIGLSDFDFA